MQSSADTVPNYAEVPIRPSPLPSHRVNELLGSMLSTHAHQLQEQISLHLCNHELEQQVYHMNSVLGQL